MKKKIHPGNPRFHKSPPDVSRHREKRERGGISEVFPSTSSSSSSHLPAFLSVLHIPRSHFPKKERQGPLPAEKNTEKGKGGMRPFPSLGNTHTPFRFLPFLARKKLGERRGGLFETVKNKNRFCSKGPRRGLKMLRYFF